MEDFISAWRQKHGIPDAVLLEWKNKLMELVNNRIAILKVKNTNNYPTGTSSFKYFFKKWFSAYTWPVCCCSNWHS